jgi:hypothetical protein
MMAAVIAMNVSHTALQLHPVQVTLLLDTATASAVIPLTNKHTQIQVSDARGAPLNQKIVDTKVTALYGTLPQQLLHKYEEMAVTGTYSVTC